MQVIAAIRHNGVAITASQLVNGGQPMRKLDSSDQNHLLASILETGCEELHSRLEWVPMTFGEVIYEAESKLVHVYFPTTAVMSLLTVMEDGLSDETAFVGSEGIVGVPLFLGTETSPHRVVVRRSGHAFRLNGQLLLTECKRSARMQHLLLRYTQALLTQISQTMVCHRHHSIGQQFCTWLLSSIDRLPSNELQLTHESIAGMLGVRRETITKEAGELQAAGLIQNKRGRILVIDRPRLESRACECYHDIDRTFRRLLNGTAVFCRPRARTAEDCLPVPRVANRAQIAASPA